MHAECVAKHYPCPDGWNNKEEKSTEQQPEPALPEPAPVSTPPKQNPNAELARQLMAQAEALLKGGDTNQSATSYPQSLTKAGHQAVVPLANLGIAPDATGNSGSAVQYSKPRDADSVKLLEFPKPGMSFEKWSGHAIDSMSAATSHCTEAYRWALVCGGSERPLRN